MSSPVVRRSIIQRGDLKRTMRQYRKTYEPMNRRRKRASTWVLFHQSTPGMIESRQSSHRRAGTLIVDYGVGNVGSIRNMLYRLGVDAPISGDPELVSQAERLILPGVGAFDEGMRQLKERASRAAPSLELTKISAWARPRDFSSWRTTARLSSSVTL